MGRRKKGYIDTSPRSLKHGKGAKESYNFQRLLLYYSNIGLNMYEWKNLPKGVESRHIEKALFYHGQAFFVQTNTGYKALKCSPNGNYNVYKDPLSVIVNGYGYNKSFKIDKGVRILNNTLAVPTEQDIIYFCKKIDDLEFAIERNLKYQNSPYIFLCTKENEFSARLIMDKIDNNEPSIILDKNLEINGKEGLQTIDIKKEFLADRFRREQLEYEKQLLTRLGLNCTISKEGGMSSTELNSNNMLIEMNQDLGLTYRKKAVEEINKKFNLNISVEAVADRLNFFVDDNGNYKDGIEGSEGE